MLNYTPAELARGVHKRFNPSQPRNKDGEWTSGGLAKGDTIHLKEDKSYSGTVLFAKPGSQWVSARNNQTGKVETLYARDIAKDSQAVSAPKVATPSYTPKQLALAKEDWFDFYSGSAIKAASRGESLTDFHGSSGRRGLSSAEESRAREQAAILQHAATHTNSGYELLFRGEAYSSAAEVRHQYKIGNVVTMNGLTAASPDKSIAGVYADPEQFLGLEKGQGAAVMVSIHNPKGVVGVVREKGAEVIVPNGATYTVERSWKDGQVLRVSLKASDSPITD